MSDGIEDLEQPDLTASLFPIAPASAKGKGFPDVDDLLLQEVYSLREKLKIAVAAIKANTPGFDDLEFVHQLNSADFDELMEELTEEELKPCPFCGTAAERIDIDPTDENEPNAGGSYISCPVCLASSKIVFGEKIGLEESWNRRDGPALRRHQDEIDEKDSPPIPEPLYPVGHEVQVRDINWKWINATVKAIEPHYHYLMTFPPCRSFLGGEISGLGAVFVEGDGAFGIRPKPEGEPN